MLPSNEHFASAVQSYELERELEWNKNRKHTNQIRKRMKNLTLEVSCSTAAEGTAALLLFVPKTFTAASTSAAGTGGQDYGSEKERKKKGKSQGKS